MLGTREPEIYGDTTLKQIEDELTQYVQGKNLELSFFQSNHEGAIIDKIQATLDDALIINAGAFTHYSIAIHDALRAASIPTIEVHMSNIYKREEFRHKSLISPVAIGGIFGLGKNGYKLAIDAVLDYLDS